MKLFLANFRWFPAFFLLAMLTVVGAKQVVAEEYIQEVFLQLPGAYADPLGTTYGPTGIGIDFNDNLCVFFSRTLTFYDSAGDTVRQLQLEYGHDFCFDEEGNIYVSKNNSGEISIRKYNSSGDPLGEMYNYKILPPAPAREYFSGRYINYIPGVGLYLHFNWPHILFQFSASQFPDAFLQSEVEPGYIFGRDKYLLTDDGSQDEIDITVHNASGPEEVLHLEGYRCVWAIPIYSLDTDHQYYSIYSFVEGEPNELENTLQKLDGDELLFSTSDFPPNRIEYSLGKKFVVDSRGIIYYYCGDENEIQIIRWIPANIDH